MNNKFPEITNISQLEHLRDVPEFIFKSEGDLTIVFYAVAFPDTFSDELRKECRGIVFDANGDVHSRPYHKFFNLNEKEETQEENVNFDIEHHFLDKLDGSMVRPVVCDGKLRLFTKAGLSDVALEAEQLALTDNIRKYCDAQLEFNMTPIFEYVGSPNYPIVLKYEEPKLILTAIRNNKSGRYVSRSLVNNTAISWGFDVVKELKLSNIKNAVKLAEDLVDAEGYVVRFNTGHMLKVKGAWYCKRHSAKEKILVPRKLVRLILENDIDDVMPDLSDKEREYVTDFENRLERNMNQYEKSIQKTFDICIQNAGVERSAFAYVVKQLNIQYPHILFKLLDGKNLTEVLIADILKSCSKDKHFERYSFLIEE